MRRVLKWTARGALGLLGLVVVALAVVYGATEARFRRSYAIEPVAVALTDDPALVERGRHVATIRGCMDCHSGNFSGQLFIDEPMIGRLFASNLTRGRGGVGATYSEEDWVRAIRHGVGPDGKPLLFMPSYEYNVLSDDDTRALIAYLRSLPAVDNEPVANRVGPVGRILFLKGDLPLLPAEMIDHEAPRGASPAPGPTVEYGGYLASGCTGCHGPTLAGGPIPGAPPGFPPAANITPDPETGIGRWTQDDFTRTLRTGVRPDGTALRPEMPWKLIAAMTDDEMTALWLYVSQVPAREMGAR